MATESSRSVEIRQKQHLMYNDVAQKRGFLQGLLHKA